MDATAGRRLTAGTPAPDRSADLRRGELGTKAMSRLDLTRRLVGRLTNGEVVVSGIGNASFDLFAAGPRPENFYMLGSMSLAVPIALGVALAQPSRRVFAIEGDGSMLMNLGALATVARGTGIVQSAWARDEAEFERLIGEGLSGRGPRFVAARVNQESGASRP